MSLERRSAEKTSTYYELLQDPRWQRKRLEVLQRNDFRCEKCNAPDKTLHVHHKRYVKGWKPWEYPDHDLEGLCEDCHTERQEVRDRLLEALSMQSEGLFMEMMLCGAAYGAMLQDNHSHEFTVDLPWMEYKMGVAMWFGIANTWEVAKHIPDKCSYGDVISAIHDAEEVKE